MKVLTFSMIVAFAAGCAVAAATERSISQKGKVFSETELTVKKGDSLLFVNDDTVNHNVPSSRG
jgi:plastocyanin